MMTKVEINLGSALSGFGGPLFESFLDAFPEAAMYHHFRYRLEITSLEKSGSSTKVEGIIANPFSSGHYRYASLPGGDVRFSLIYSDTSAFLNPSHLELLDPRNDRLLILGSKQSPDQAAPRGPLSRTQRQWAYDRERKLRHLLDEIEAAIQAA